MIRSLAIVVLALNLSAAFAQTTGSATIVGNITDTTGAVIPGAKVAVINTETGFRFDGVTNGEGYFYVPYLRPGIYNLTVEGQASRSTCTTPSSCEPTTNRVSTSSSKLAT